VGGLAAILAPDAVGFFRFGAEAYFGIAME
jgi:hypothetical protein